MWYDWAVLARPSTSSDLALQPTLSETVEAAGEPESTPAAEAQSRVTQRLGRFLLLRSLGEGGMGMVFAAYDEQLDRKVAVKLLHPRGLEQGMQRQRVLREAQAMARVSHPNVVHVYDVGELGSQIFIAMEYVEGMTLADWQQKRPGSWREILALYRQAGKGLLAAHQAGLVHRDFKPENVLVDKEGCARVADFGLARLQGEPTPELRPPAPRISQPVLQSPLTATGTLSGTPGYMSPEQFRCEPADSRSDQFSFCVALYEALYHQRPFTGETIAEVAAEVLAGRLRPVPVDTLVPIEIASALARGLAIAPDQRFPTLKELLDALDIEGESDPAGARTARVRFSAIVGIVTVLVAIVSLNRSRQVASTMGELTIVMGLVALMFVAIITTYRKSLLSNSFHRGLTLLTLSCVIIQFSMRLMAWHLGIDILKYYPLDLLLLAGTFLLYAVQYMSSLWGFVALPVVCALAAAHWPKYAHLLSNLVYTMVPMAFIYSWFALSNRPRKSVPAPERKWPPSARLNSK